MRRWQLVIDDTGSVEDILAFIYCKKWRFGQVLPMPHSLTDSQSKDRATQLLKKYKSGALVTQLCLIMLDCVINGDDMSSKSSKGNQVISVLNIDININ